MKTTLLALAVLSITLPIHAGWLVRPDATRITYSAERGEGHASFSEALKKLSDGGRIQKLDGIIAYALLSDDALQAELLAGLKRDAPRQLKEAQESAGNMHNPKMHQLWQPFEKALLATPTLIALNASLAAHGLIIRSASVEKFELRTTQTDPTRRFHGGLWLYVTPLPNAGTAP